MQLADTHCHIHEAARPFKNGDPTRSLWGRLENANPDQIIARANQANVTRLICVGTTLEDSRLAVDLVQTRPGCWASIGIHPHEAKDHLDPKTRQAFAGLTNQPKIVAVGECGLDYYYGYSSKADQENVLRFQINLALKQSLPMIFHIRDAFDDFWKIFDDYQGIRGVVHSFTATHKELEQALQRGLYIGLNGIMTFTKNPEQLSAARAVPMERLLLETDAPFLTPVPHRGTICEPRHICDVAKFLAELRGETLENIAKTTTKNAKRLFNLT